MIPITHLIYIVVFLAFVTAIISYCVDVTVWLNGEEIRFEYRNINYPPPYWRSQIVEKAYRLETVKGGPILYELEHRKDTNQFIKYLERTHAQEIGISLLEAGLIEIKHNDDQSGNPNYHYTKSMSSRLRIYKPEESYNNKYQHLHV